MNYYNEHDPKTAAWLRELINRKLIPAGIVDERSIVDVQADDLREFTQCHFFAGIGGWSLALQLAEWPEDRPVWTGSCPCQPFSTAGKGLAQQDERHLWPVFFNLIRQCRPECVFGEQVASAIGHGWLDGVSADLEAEGYACGAVVLGAHSVRSPHQRQRLYWVANSQLQHERSARSHEARTGDVAWMREADRLAHMQQQGLQRHGRLGEKPFQAGWKGAERHSAESGAVGGMVLSNSDGCSTRSPSAAPSRHWDTTEPTGFWVGWVGNSNSEQTDSTKQRQQMSSKGLLRCWDASRLVHCRDGKTRRIPTQPSFFPLAHGIPARVVRLRGYGNAIVPQVAAEFIQAFYEAANHLPRRAEKVE